MSARAAWRLERLGFPVVYDYVAGKMDWLAFGLPHDGSARLVVEVAQRDVPTCRPSDDVGTVGTLLQGADVMLCPVLDDHGVVLGAIRRERLDKVVAETPAEEAMDFAISTIRPSVELHTLVDRMEQATTEAMIVTRPDGTLFGVAAPDQVRQRL